MQLKIIINKRDEFSLNSVWLNKYHNLKIGVYSK